MFRACLCWLPGLLLLLLHLDEIGLVLLVVYEVRIDAALSKCLLRILRVSSPASCIYVRRPGTSLIEW